MFATLCINNYLSMKKSETNICVYAFLQNNKTFYLSKSASYLFIYYCKLYSNRLTFRAPNFLLLYKLQNQLSLKITARNIILGLQIKVS